MESSGKEMEPFQRTHFLPIQKKRYFRKSSSFGVKFETRRKKGGPKKNAYGSVWHVFGHGNVGVGWGGNGELAHMVDA